MIYLDLFSVSLFISRGLFELSILEQQPPILLAKTEQKTVLILIEIDHYSVLI